MLMMPDTLELAERGKPLRRRVRHALCFRLLCQHPGAPGDAVFDLFQRARVQLPRGSVESFRFWSVSITLRQPTCFAILLS